RIGILVGGERQTGLADDSCKVAITREGEVYQPIAVPVSRRHSLDAEQLLVALECVEAAIAAPGEIAEAIGVGAGGEVELAVAVEITRHERADAGIGGEYGGSLECPVSPSEEYLDGRAAVGAAHELRHGNVGASIAVEVARHQVANQVGCGDHRA